MAAILRQRRDTTANWTSENPVVPDGQLCFDTDTHVFRLGDGSNNYLDLPEQIGAQLDATNVYTAPQIAAITAEDNAIDFDATNNFTLTATAANITASNLNVGQAGTIVITTAENITGWGTEFKFPGDVVPADLDGIETFGYFTDTGSTIRIGRVS